LLHGEAVAIGCLWAARFSAQRGLCPDADVQRIEAHLRGAGMMTVPPFMAGADALMAAMRGDKKAQGGQITLVLMRGIGQAFIARDTDEQELLGFLKQVTGKI